MARGKVQATAEAGAVQGPWTLPDEWRWSQLGEYVSKAGASINPSQSPEGDFQIYSVPSFPTGQPETLKGREIGSSKQAVHVDDILLCKINPRINRVWRVQDFGTGNLIASTEWIRFGANEDIEPDYLRYFLMRKEIRDYLAMNASGVGGSLMRVRPSTVDPLPFPVAPRETQRSIVTRIDELFTEIDDGEAALERARGDLATWRKALLKAAVTGELTADWRAANPPAETGAALLVRILSERRTRWLAERRTNGKRYSEPSKPNVDDLPDLPNGWVWASLDQLCWASGYGTSEKCAVEATGTAVLRIPNIKQGRVTLSDLKRTAGVIRLGNGALAPGDLLIIRTNGSEDLIGRAAIVLQELPEPTYFASYLIRLRLLGPSQFHRWIGALIDSPIFRSAVLRSIGSSAGQYNLNLTNIERFAVPIPPLGEVDAAITSFSEAARGVSDAITSASSLGMAAATLRQSILAAAFRGDLVQ